MRTIAWDLCIALAAIVGFGAGYLLIDKTAGHYAVDATALPPVPENDLIRYGRDLVVDTPRYIGRSAQDPAMAYGGNDLACQSCHLKAGLQPYAAPFVSTAATFPMMADNKVITLPDRINSCMTLGLNGKPLSEDSREMAALLAYIKYLGKGTPEGVRLPGMGAAAHCLSGGSAGLKAWDRCLPAALRKLSRAGRSRRGQIAAGGRVHRAAGWGPGSFNGAAGMGQTAYAASYIRATMPVGVDYAEPILTVQEAWDVAANIIANPHPIAPPEAGPEPETPETPE